MSVAPHVSYSPSEAVLSPLVLVSDSSYSSIDEITQLLGWNELPSDLLQVIKKDLQLFNAEIRHQFSAFTADQIERKKRVYFWISQFKSGYTSLSTTIQALS